MWDVDLHMLHKHCALFNEFVALGKALRMYRNLFTPLRVVIAIISITENQAVLRDPKLGSRTPSEAYS